MFCVIIPLRRPVLWTFPRNWTTRLRWISAKAQIYPYRLNNYLYDEYLFLFPYKIYNLRTCDSFIFILIHFNQCKTFIKMYVYICEFCLNFKTWIRLRSWQKNFDWHLMIKIDYFCVPDRHKTRKTSIYQFLKFWNINLLGSVGRTIFISFNQTN